MSVLRVVSRARAIIIVMAQCASAKRRHVAHVISEKCRHHISLWEALMSSGVCRHRCVCVGAEVRGTAKSSAMLLVALPLAALCWVPTNSPNAGVVYQATHARSRVSLKAAPDERPEDRPEISIKQVSAGPSNKAVRPFHGSVRGPTASFCSFFQSPSCLT